MVFLMGATVVYYFRNLGRINSRAILNPMTFLLLAHYAWMWIATIYSQNIFVSVKFCLAKTWYIATFFFLSLILLRHKGLFRQVIKAVVFPLFFVVCIILYRHYQEGFSFEAANFVMAPFFRNHVNSAAMMTVVVPFVLYLILTTKRFINRAFYISTLLILIAGILFSYTRAAHLSVILALGVLPVFHFRLVKWAAGIAVIVVIFLSSSLIEKNHYLDYAPEFEKTISHSNFEDLVSATYQGQDISTMERVYRWVAAFHMYSDRPLMGFGPGNFYNFYKRYTVTTFQTYVSDNPEKSGVHCYYLMVLVEQGILGLIIFALLLIYALLKLESLYHSSKSYKEKLLVVTLGMSLTIIILFQLINDLIETDKVGPFFFFILAMIVALDLSRKGQKIISE
jgi:O-antigen ligase